MNKITATLVIFLLINISTAIVNADTYSRNNPISKEQNSMISLFQQYLQKINNNYVNDFVFSPEDVELKDDAFHGSSKFGFAEWWYFDAMLSEGYSIEANIQFISVANRVFAIAKINIYKDGILQLNEKKFYLPADFYVSEDIPLIELDGKQVMNGYIDKSGNFVYNLSLSINDAYIDLQFVGYTKGWKGVTPISGWGVFLPNSDVTGTIKLGVEEIYVNGKGYHDHNWDIGLKSGINFGWYWGKINTDNYTIIWSQILGTRFQGQPLLVINEKNGGYFNINPEDIQFDVGDMRFTNGLRIPHSFALALQTEQFSTNVDMKSIGTHHIRRLGFVNYWRYHMECTGSLTIGSQVEIIDGVFVAELVRLRR